MKKILLTISLCIYVLTAVCQKAYVNTPSGIFELTGGVGSCGYTAMTNICEATFGNSVYSLAIYKDTIYYNTSSGELRRFKVGVPGSCQSMGNVGSYNSMTVDKNGIVYMAGTQLIRYNPYTNQTTNLGNIPFSSAGDLIFFNDKLLLAGSPPGIYEININNPPASTLYMSTNGLGFFGLISYPATCTTIRYFGLAPGAGGTQLVELDLVNKIVIGNVCTLPLNVYDAASITEGGFDAGILITGLDIGAVCPPATTTTVNVSAISSVPGTLTFTLDGISNATGSFSNVGTGNHLLSITSTGGCSKDSAFTIVSGLDPVISIQKTNSNNCDNNNGSVTLTANSNHLPIKYTLVNTGLTQTSGNFTNLASGIYNFHIADAVNCSKDTSVEVFLTQPAFLDSINVRDAHCGANSGQIKISVAASAADAVSSLNNGPFTNTFLYDNLAPGSYYVQVKKGTGCFFDTTVVILSVIDIKPAVVIQVSNQHCFDDNGMITLNVTGADGPYSYQLNGGGFVSSNKFSLLAPGNYTISIKNKFGCSWDTTTSVAAYPKSPVVINVDHTDPTCRNINSGTLKVLVTGQQSPYMLLLNGAAYSNGQTITNLTNGNYNVLIQNSDACIIDSVSQALTISYEPACNSVYIPNAFTPDNNGVNDVFRPVYSYFITNVTFNIYNRYGQKIYSGTGSNVGWDGTFKGLPQNAGVYIYTLGYTDYFKVNKTLKGSLMLLR